MVGGAETGTEVRGALDDSQGGSFFDGVGVPHCIHHRKQRSIQSDLRKITRTVVFISLHSRTKCLPRSSSRRTPLTRNSRPCTFRTMPEFIARLLPHCFRLWKDHRHGTRRRWASRDVAAIFTQGVVLLDWLQGSCSVDLCRRSLIRDPEGRSANWFGKGPPENL